MELILGTILWYAILSVFQVIFFCAKQKKLLLIISHGIFRVFLALLLLLCFAGFIKFSIEIFLICTIINIVSDMLFLDKRISPILIMIELVILGSRFRTPITQNNVPTSFFLNSNDIILAIGIVSFIFMLVNLKAFTQPVRNSFFDDMYFIKHENIENC